MAFDIQNGNFVFDSEPQDKTILANLFKNIGIELGSVVSTGTSLTVYLCGKSRPLTITTSYNKVIFACGNNYTSFVFGKEYKLEVLVKHIKRMV